MATAGVETLEELGEGVVFSEEVEAGAAEFSAAEEFVPVAVSLLMPDSPAFLALFRWINFDMPVCH